MLFGVFDGTCCVHGPLGPRNPVSGGGDGDGPSLVSCVAAHIPLVPHLPSEPTPLRPHILMATKAAYKRVGTIPRLLRFNSLILPSSQRSMLPCRRSHPRSFGLPQTKKTF